MDFVFGKGVAGADFLAGFAAGSIHTLTVFAVRPVRRDEESAAVFELLVQYISPSKVHKFIVEPVLHGIYVTEFRNLIQTAFIFQHQNVGIFSIIKSIP